MKLAILLLALTTVACNATAAAPPADRAWTDYQIIMWQKPTPKQAPGLKQLGVTAGVFGANRDENGPFIDKQIETFLAADLRWYVENIATDFYAPYHKWTPGHAVNWRFVEAQKLYQDNPSDRRAFVRDPSLSDPQFLSKICERITRTVQAHARYKPLYYSLGDETGIGDLAAFWDFDLSDDSLRGMRDWLKTQYGTLAALNRQWGSRYAAWDDIMPMTTSEAMKRTDDNFSAWADFKAWMDVAYARALRAGTDAVHEADPKALAGIEGGQIPGWGGYDYTQLANAVDVMELYDFGDNVEIVRSLNPQMIILNTSFNGGPAETHRVWHELLQGSRGLILWDEKNEFVGEDGSLGPRGREAAPTYREIRDGLGALLIGSARHSDPVAIFYSPASMRTSWMLDWKGKGDGWSRRDAEAEYEATPLRSAMAGYLRRVEHAGLQPVFVSPQRVEQGELDRAGFRILILPHAIALSKNEADAIRRFARQGGTVIADIEPGTFDQHSRRLPKPPLADLFNNPSAAGKGRALYVTTDAPAFAGVLKDSGVTPAMPVEMADGDPATDTRTYIFAHGGTTLVALQRDLTDGTPGQGTETVEMTLPGDSYAYDVRQHKMLGRSHRLRLALDPVEPTIISVSNTPISAPLEAR